MHHSRPGLVDIARDFLEAHQLMRRLFARHREGALRFKELEKLVGDDEGSLLFRLKERCHHSFRAGAGAAPMHREALFDLAVGSLFHEAMKFRENFYQREVYGPRVQALLSEAESGESALFDEFARIQQGVSHNLDEGLAETEALLARTLGQLRLLLAAHGDDPLVARFLVEHAATVESVFSRPLDAILAEIYGAASPGYRQAGLSLLRSGYYAQAIEALRQAAEHGDDGEENEVWVAYARGMEAYLARDYAESVAQLSRWDHASAAVRGQESRLAQDAVARICQLADGPDREQVVADASQLLGRWAPPGD